MRRTKSYLGNRSGIAEVLFIYELNLDTIVNPREEHAFSFLEITLNARSFEQTLLCF